MAGRHTPARVFEAGSPFYLRGEEKVPVPFLPNGEPNTFFEAEYKKLVERLAAWCRKNGSPLLHMAWYGQDWAELNHGQEVRAAPGYRYENWLRAHMRLLDIAFETADAKLSTELPFSGHGPLTDAASRFADYVVSEIGGSTSHLASLARERGIPMVLGVLDATGRIPDGSQVAVDGVAGIVRWMA